MSFEFVFLYFHENNYACVTCFPNLVQANFFTEQLDATISQSTLHSVHRTPCVLDTSKPDRHTLVQNVLLKQASRALIGQTFRQANKEHKQYPTHQFAQLKTAT